jgi:hypothetical protein
VHVTIYSKAAIGIAVGVGAGVGLWGTGVAHASTHRVPLQFECSFPVIGDQPVSGEIDWDFPGAVTVGRPTPPVPITATIEVPSGDIEAAHQFLGVASASGNGTGSATVVAPQGNIPVSLSASVPSTNVPASGSVTVVIPATFPSITPTRPGVAKVTMGAITMHITPRDSSGGVTFPGTVTSTCTLAPGQSDVVASIRIDPAPQVTVPTVHPTTAAPTPTHHPRPTPPPHPPSPTHTARPTPTPTRTFAAPVADSGPSGGTIAAIGGSAAVVGGGVIALLRWLVRPRP